jgi:DNA topoisomerase-1
MTKNLVIVESPAKAKTIGKYLGQDFEVKASVGHVMDLPPRRLGVDLDDGEFTPEYEPISGKSKVIKEIKDAAKKADVIYLAPDPDREGEAIAFHVAQICKEAAKTKKKKTKKKAKKKATKKASKKAEAEVPPEEPETPAEDADMGPQIRRVLFHEITKKAVNEAFKTPLELNTDKYDAQQARRILDRLVGYQISPILWKKVRRGLSAGRVQSVAVRICVDREREIEAFEPVEYWTIAGLADAGKEPIFDVKLAKTDGKKSEIDNGKDAAKIVEEIKAADAKIAKVEKRKRQRKPQPPFITSKLQQDAARALRFTAKRTMGVAQSLYEGVELGDEGAVGLITYMRTDSTRVSDEALSQVRELIQGQYGGDYLPEKPNVYKGKKGAQDAHEAIRPTSMERSPEAIKGFLTPEQYKLYKLIWDRFVASQMNPAQYDQTTIDVGAGRHTLRATGSILRFAGFLKVYEERADEDAGKAPEQVAEGKILPDVAEGDLVKLDKVDGTQHFTQPPPRFTEASLVKELEEKGIGRPSTYASILSVIQDKGYVEKNEGRFHPTELGTVVTGLLVESFPNILDIAFTAGMEEALDKVEEGGVDWKKTLRDFYTPFKARVEEAAENMRDIKRMEEPTDITCDKCNEHTMVIKWGKNGSFLGCAGYPDCKNTKEYKRVEGKIIPQEAQDFGIDCKTCGAPMVVKAGRYGAFLGCSRYPECNFTMPMPTGIKCPKDQGEVTQRRSRRGRIFYGCSNYPDCDFVSWDKPRNQECPACGNNYLVQRDTKSGTTVKCPVCNHTLDPDEVEALNKALAEKEAAEKEAAKKAKAEKAGDDPDGAKEEASAS